MNNLQEIQQFIHSPAFKMLSHDSQEELRQQERQFILAHIKDVAEQQFSTLAKEHGEPIRIKMSLELNGKAKVSFDDYEEDLSIGMVRDSSDEDLYNKQEPLLTHSLDWSPFEYGFTIDKKYHEALLKALAGKELPRGGFVPVVIEYDGEEFNAIIDHPDVKSRPDNIYRLIYRGKYKIGDKLKENFPDTYKYIKALKEEHGGRFQVKLPDELKATIALFEKESPTKFKFECKK